MKRSRWMAPWVPYLATRRGSRATRRANTGWTALHPKQSQVSHVSPMVTSDYISLEVLFGDADFTNAHSGHRNVGNYDGWPIFAHTEAEWWQLANFWHHDCDEWQLNNRSFQGPTTPSDWVDRTAEGCPWACKAECFMFKPDLRWVSNPISNKEPRHTCLNVPKSAMTSHGQS